MTLAGRFRAETRFRARRPARAAVLAATLALSQASCAKPDAVPWEGEYSGESDSAQTSLATLAIGKAKKGLFPFSLVLMKDNGYSREVAGVARCKGRAASFKGEGIEIGFEIAEGEADGIRVEAGGEAIGAEGFETRMRLERRPLAVTAPEASASPASESAKGDFAFGYYLPEGSDAQALPESLSLLLFAREGMKAREVLMFEGSLSEGREFGIFSVEEGRVVAKSKDPKTGKTIETSWTREADGRLKNDSGQRFAFWKDNLER